MTVRTQVCAGITLVVVVLALSAKPLRLMMPSAFGLHCTGSVCVEQRGDYAQAIDLYERARSQVAKSIYSLDSNPRFIFCRTRSCYQRFGGGQERAISYPYLGTVIAPESWQPYILRHEFIHWLQFQNYGVLKTMSHQVWFREGMAYSLSGAPVVDIPAAHMPLVRRYEDWQAGKTQSEIWQTDAVLD